MAKIKGYCRNIDGCDLAAEKVEQEAEKSNFVCSECGKPLYPIDDHKGGSKGGGINKKLIAIIGGAVVVIAAIVGAVFAFSGNKEPESINLNTATMKLVVGESQTLKVTQLNEDKYKKLKLKWKAISDESSKVVDVSQDGKVTALRAGKATVSVCLAKNEKVKAECNVTVEEKAVVGPTTPQLVDLKPKSVTLKEGETVKLEPQTEPADTNVTITWTSANANIASVASDGTVKAVKAGTTTITGTLNDKQVTANVTVKKTDDGGGTGPGGNPGRGYGPVTVSYGKYTGYLQNGKPHGHGTVVFTSSYQFAEGISAEPGDKYEGDFRNGRIASIGYLYHDGNQTVVRP